MKASAVALLSLALFAAPLAAGAEPAVTVHRIGFLSATAASGYATQMPIVELAARNRAPVMYWEQDAAQAGGLIAYATDVSELHRRADILDSSQKGRKHGA
jgi:hypothetical protein